MFGVQSLMSPSLRDDFPELSEALPRHHVAGSMNAHPKLSVETATQLAVFLANRPGALARVCQTLADAGINIYALTTPIPSITPLCGWWLAILPRR